MSQALALFLSGHRENKSVSTKPCAANHDLRSTSENLRITAIQSLNGFEQTNCPLQVITITSNACLTQTVEEIIRKEDSVAPGEIEIVSSARLRSTLITERPRFVQRAIAILVNRLYLVTFATVVGPNTALFWRVFAHASISVRSKRIVPTD